MNTEILERILTAKEYQKKAIYALFPEEMSGHLEVIEKEFKIMAAELVKACVRNEQSKTDKRESRENSRVDNHRQNSDRQNGTRKIDIT
ncbi:MAG: hypothetical protein K2L82_16540 [Lachnospiraceae bacterium]|nr:hypothetical protein [Lachnospiraceae bacterium]